jgi:hypothetical protein
MAKKSKIAKNDQRAVIVERWAAKRLELKKALVDPNGTEESREAARLGLQKLPRDAPARCPQPLRHLPCAVPRHGAPRRIARHHQVELVTPAQEPRSFPGPGFFAFPADVRHGRRYPRKC